MEKGGRSYNGKNFLMFRFKENRDQDLQCFWHKIAIALCEVIFDFEYQTKIVTKNPMRYQIRCAIIKHKL